MSKSKSGWWMRDRLAKEVAALMFKEKRMDRVGSHSFRTTVNSPAGMKSSRDRTIYLKYFKTHEN